MGGCRGPPPLLSISKIPNFSNFPQMWNVQAVTEGVCLGPPCYMHKIPNCTFPTCLKIQTRIWESVTHLVILPPPKLFDVSRLWQSWRKRSWIRDQANKNDDDINAGDDDDYDEDDNKYSSTTVLSHDPDRETWSPQRQHAQSTSSTTARPTHTTKNMLMCFVLINTNTETAACSKTIIQQMQHTITKSTSSTTFRLLGSA